MNTVLLKKLKESLISVLPITVIVFLLNLTPFVDFSWYEMGVFLIASVLLIFGIGLFSLGADIAMTPMGEHIGAGLVKTKKLLLLFAVCFAMGLLITVAEPDLTVLAGQVQGLIDSTALILTVGIGVGVFLLLAVLKIVFRVNLSAILLYFYMFLFALAALVILNGNTDFLPLAFDSGGVTTGPITVPFIMALGVGIATTIGGRHSGENSFGLVALCSVGPILAVMCFGVGLSGEIDYHLPDYTMSPDVFSAFGTTLLTVMKDVSLALALIVIFFAILQLVCLKLPRRKLYQIAVGILYTFFGLVIFLTAVHVGFMPIGYKLGTQIADLHPAAVAAFGFVIGMVVVLAEPAVHVLNKQVEEITEGSVGHRSMMIALSCGIGVSIALSLLRIIFDFNILFYLIPGYFLSLGLSFFVPRMYTAIAFDSGGVASGPLTSTFILPFAIGVCYALQGEGKILADALGVVAMVAMTPLITIQLLGFQSIVRRKVRENIAMKRILASDDEQIITFM